MFEAPCFHLIHEWIYRCPACKKVGISNEAVHACCNNCDTKCSLNWYPDMNDDFYNMIQDYRKTDVFKPVTEKWLAFIGW